MKKLILLGIFCYFAIHVSAQVTYTKDIAPILYNKCSVCHRPGEIGPFSLTNYEEAKNWSNTIKVVTATRYMPPWKPDPEYSTFLGENFLTDEEIQKIAEWADNGAIQGDLSDEPEFPDFPDGSVLGEPDLVLSFAESFEHQGNNQDEYRYFVLPTGLSEEKIVKAAEFRPGNTKIVHHALLFEDLTGQAAQNDAATPEYGFSGFGSFTDPTNPTSILDQKQFPGYVPGQKPIFYPDGLGQTLGANSDLVIQVHYAPWSTNELDSSSVNLFFAENEETIDRTVETHIMVPLPGVLVDDQFFIPPNTVKNFHGVWTIPEDVSFMGIAPHMHLLGEDWEVYIEHQDGSRTDLISIPDWDFNWQGTYYFNRFHPAKAGDEIHAFATYDNTSENPNNPNNPPQWVTWGEGTEDEMYYLPLLYVPYQDGDEDIIFDSTTGFDELGIDVPDNKIYPIYPNPVQGMINTGFSLSHGQSVNIQILDINGKVIRTLREFEYFGIGDHIVHFNAEHLESGIYFFNINGKQFQLTEKFVKL